MDKISKRIARIERLNTCLRLTLQKAPGADREALILHFMGEWPDTTRRTICEYLGLIMQRNGWIADGEVIKKDTGFTPKTQTNLGAYEENGSAGN